VLGDWTAVCLRCGAARRWFEELEAELPAECPSCGGELLHRCPVCSAPFSSTFAVDCEHCGAKLREPELFGIRIRRADR
jgi:DNA-directed RNA polymerase subunit RPC12/RpoP